VTYYPHQLKFSHEALVGQFIITTREQAIPTGWRAESHGRWTLGTSDPVPVIPVHNQTGGKAGWLIGHVITERGQFLLPGNPAEAPVLGPVDDFGAFVDRLNGRFVAVDLRSPDPRVFPDGQASLAAVWSEAEQCVASTTTLIPRSAATPFLVERILLTDIPYSDGMYPLGLTHRAGVERLLPNHVLDLGSWQHRRRWPLAPIDRAADPHAVAALVGSAVRSALGAVHAVFPLDLTLTAGRDSRMMLACAGPWRDEIRAYTCYVGDLMSWRDVTVATRIAQATGITHRVLAARSGRRELVDWVVRTGAEAGETRGWRHGRAFADQSPGRATITGVAAWISTIGKRRLNFLKQPITPERVLTRCKAPPRKEYLDRAADWLANLSSIDDVAISDLLLIEQRQGCWAGVIEYGELGESSARLSPMTSGTIIHAVLRLPMEYRIGRRLHLDVIERNWPELLEFPFNEDVPTPRVRSGIFALRAGIARRRAPLARIWRKVWTQPGWLRRTIFRLGRSPRA